MSTFTYTPIYGVQLNTSPRVRNARFGGGYSQRTADGINTEMREWSVQFQGNTSEMDAIEAFLSAEAGVTSFDWTPPTGDAGRWTCDNWTRSINGYNNEQVSATFSEVFGE